jgi:hypothetical protein
LLCNISIPHFLQPLGAEYCFLEHIFKPNNKINNENVKAVLSQPLLDTENARGYIYSEDR